MPNATAAATSQNFEETEPISQPSSQSNGMNLRNMPEPKAKASDDGTSFMYAVSRSRAMVELALDCTILNANANFLHLFGYTLDELQGRNHALLVSTARGDAFDERRLWSKLSRGEYGSGEFPRLTKDGREVWILGAYIALIDGTGTPYKVICFGNDITAAKLAATDFKNQMATLLRTQAVIEFKMDGTILKANDNFLTALGYSLDEIVGKHHGMFV